MNSAISSIATDAKGVIQIFNAGKRDEATRSIPVIALTALAMKGDEARIRAAGCDGDISKPMRYLEFLKTIATQLARR